jgi:hypothetical protein
VYIEVSSKVSREALTEMVLFNKIIKEVRRVLHGGIYPQI